MKKIYLLFSVLLLSGSIVLGIENPHPGARSKGLANASVTLSDLWSTNNNQAGLGFLKKAGAGITYENRFFLRELALKGLTAALPTGIGTFGLTVQQFGYSEYNENKFGLAYGMQLGKNIAIGVQIDYYHIRLAGDYYPNKNALSAEIGFLANITDKLSVGAHVFNISNSKFNGNAADRLPVIFRLGADYKFSEKVFAVIEVEKDIDRKALVKFGVEYHPVDVLYLRAGVRADDFQFAFGAGIQWKIVQFDLAASYQNYLGFVTQATLAFQFGKERK